MSGQGARAPALAGTASADTAVSLKTWIAVGSALLGAFMAVLNIQVTNSSLPDIEGGIGTGGVNGTWISTAYLIGEIVVIPLTDYLSRVFSFRRYMLASAALFAVFSVACAFTHDLPSMIAMRGLQGFAGGVLIPTAITIVRTRLPASKQPIGVAMFGMVATFAPAIGPTVGGWLTDNWSWHYIFYLNVVPGLVALVSRCGETHGEALGVQALEGVAGFVEAPAFYPYLSARRNLELLAAFDGGADDSES